MKSSSSNLRRWQRAFWLPLMLLAFARLLPPAAAQIPNTLKWTLAPPSTAPQDSNHQGAAVAIDGNIAVVGVPDEDLTANDVGAVKVYDATTGALLQTLTQPVQGEQNAFGYAVAISGTRIVVGVFNDNTGALGAGRAYVYDLSSGTPTVPVYTLAPPTPKSAGRFGVSVGISGARVVVGAEEQFNAGSAYVYNLAGGTPTVPIATLTNPSPVNQDYFGQSVAISGTRVVVGAPGDDTGFTDAGSAYVYDLSSGTPTVPIVTLPNPSPDASDAFGNAVAISNARVVVAAYQDDTTTLNAGTVYVYDIAGATPATPAFVLPNPTPQTFDGFGMSVSVSGSGIVVGAYQDNTGAASTGSAYFFDVAGGTPTTPLVTFHNPAPGVQDFFGIAVGFSGTRVVVGASFASIAGYQSGIAYTYDVAGATPSVPVATLNAPSPPSGDEMGYAVAAGGTYVLVGAPLDDTGANGAGSASLYDLASATPTVPRYTFRRPAGETLLMFGNAVAVSDRYAVVAAFEEGQVPANVGAVYVYDLRSATPTVPAFTLHKPNPTFNDQFGNAVALSGARVVVGTRFDDAGASDSGSAYVFDLASATPTVPAFTLANPHPSASSYFGTSVAISGTRVVVGAPQDDTGLNDAGSAYVYDLTSGTPTAPVFTLNNPAAALSDFFGWSVAISGTRVVVGANQDDAGATNAGSVYVYDVAGANPTTPIYTLANPTPVANEDFGYSVAIDGTRLVVGAFQEMTGAVDAGAAYVYNLTSGTPTTPVATILNPAPAVNDFFGNAVAIAGTTVVIGAYQDSAFASDRGAAYVYRPASNDFDADGLVDLWEEAHFGSTAAHAATDDTDHDGQTELIEEALGHDPLLPESATLPAAVVESGYLTLTISKRGGVTYQVQSAGSPASASFSAATTTVLTDTATILKVRDNVLANTPGGRFLRVKITAAP